MKTYHLAFALIAAAALPLWSLTAQGHEGRHHAIPPEAVAWTAPAAYEKGAEFAVVHGDPTQEGLYVVRLRVPAGFVIAPHTHPNDENVTVLKGSFNLGTGETFEKRGESIGVGGHAYVPHGMTHYAWFTEDTVIQLHGMGPQGIAYVNPADDPRNR